MLSQQPSTFLPVRPDALLAIPFNLTERTPGDERNFLGPTYLFENGGREVRLQPEGARVLGWPWSIAPYYSCQPRENWPTGLSLGGSLLRYQGRLLLTGTATDKGEKRSYHSVIVVSENEGRHLERPLFHRRRFRPCLGGVAIPATKGRR